MFDTPSVPPVPVGSRVAAFAHVAIQCAEEPEPVEDTPQVRVWRRHHGARGMARVHPHLARNVHDPVVVQMILTALAPFADRACGLVYVTSGFALNYRSPVLPHLLNALPPFASVAALRHEADTSLPAEALRLVEAVLREGEVCLLIHDRSRRLVAADDAARGAGGVDFILLMPSATTTCPALSEVPDLLKEGTLQ